MCDRFAICDEGQHAIMRPCVTDKGEGDLHGGGAREIGRAGEWSRGTCGMQLHGNAGLSILLCDQIGRGLRETDWLHQAFAYYYEGGKGGMRDDAMRRCPFLTPSSVSRGCRRISVWTSVFAWHAILSYIKKRKRVFPVWRSSAEFPRYTNARACSCPWASDG